MKNDHFLQGVGMLDAYRLLASIRHQAIQETVVTSMVLSSSTQDEYQQPVYCLTLAVFTPVGDLRKQVYLLEYVLTTSDLDLVLKLGGDGEKLDYHSVLVDFAGEPAVRLAKLSLLAAA